jgi:hypothetical protein
VVPHTIVGTPMEFLKASGILKKNTRKMTSLNLDSKNDIPPLNLTDSANKLNLKKNNYDRINDRQLNHLYEKTEDRILTNRTKVNNI